MALDKKIAAEVATFKLSPARLSEENFSGGGESFFERDVESCLDGCRKIFHGLSQRLTNGFG